MSTAATNVGTLIVRKHAYFMGFVLITSLAFFKPLSALVSYSLNDASSSHIVLIPFVSFFLLYFERESIFANASASTGLGIGLAAAGLILFLMASRGPIPREGHWSLSVEVLSVILVWIAGFLYFYGEAAFRAGSFALLFLLLMVPLPDPILNWIIYELQEGSTQIAYLLFQATGTPVLRHGFQLSLPTVTIEVAQECSSIRSSVALFITCLLAAHLYLGTGWKKLVLALLTLPLSLLKNGIRIATLTLLSIYVDPSFLTGRLHHEGGVVFFLLALLILLPVFWWMEKSDRRRPPVDVVT
ncbi:MAG: exosortase/archaeosortase family protein [Candidatus Acidiferrales bacterium]